MLYSITLKVFSKEGLTMKTVKRIPILIVSIFSICTMLYFSTACAPTATSLTGSMQLVLDARQEGIAPKTYTVDLTEYTDKNSVEDVINGLVESSDLYYEGYKGGYGMFYTALGYRTQNGEYEQTQYILQQNPAEGKYIYVYTTVQADKDQSNYKTEIEYNGITLINAGMGISNMHLEDGATVYFTYIV